MNRREKKKPELLAPAGSLEVLKVAVRYGADAVYIGGAEYSLRAKAKNFSSAEMREGIVYAHEQGVKVYVTANIFAHEEDLPGIRGYFRELGEMKPDALILSDPGVFRIAQEVCPEIPVHISTQANNTNAETFRFWAGLGARRVVAARELTLQELGEIRREIPQDLEMEVFVHGSMCISYSGRCLLSNYFTGRDANRGSCTHPCRWKYAVAEETRPGMYLPVRENERGTYIFNSGDLCMVGHIPELAKTGADSYKIEGRMKNALYVATASRTYRRAIDDYFEDPRLYEKNRPRYEEEISECTCRMPFTTGFFFGRPGAEAQNNGSASYARNYTYLGRVQGCGEDGFCSLEQRNKFSVGEIIEIMKPDGRNIRTAVKSIQDEEGNAMQSAPHAGQKLRVDLGLIPETNDILRRKEEEQPCQQENMWRM